MFSLKKPQCFFYRYKISVNKQKRPNHFIGPGAFEKFQKTYLVTHITITAKTSSINKMRLMPTIFEPAFFSCSAM